MPTKDPLNKWAKDDGKEVYTKKGNLDSLSIEDALDAGQTNISDKIKKLKNDLNKPTKSGKDRFNIAKELAAATKELQKARQESQKIRRSRQATEPLQKELLARLNLINAELEKRKGKQKAALDTALNDTGLESKIKDLLKEVVSNNFDTAILSNKISAINEAQSSLPKFLNLGFKAISQDIKDQDIAQKEAYAKIAAQNAQVRDMFKRTGNTILSGVGKLSMSILDRVSVKGYSVGVGAGAKGYSVGDGIRAIGAGAKGIKRAYTGVKEASHSVVNTYLKAKTFLEERSDAKQSMANNSEKKDSFTSEFKKYAERTSFFNRRLLRASEKIANKKDSTSSLFGSMLSSITSFFGPGGFLKTISSILTPIGGALALLSRVVGASAGVGLAGYLGFKAGEYLNEKFGLSDKLVQFAEFIRDKAIPSVVDTAKNVSNSVKSTYDTAVATTSQGIEKTVDFAKSTNTYKSVASTVGSGGSVVDIASSAAEGISRDSAALGSAAGSAVKSGLVSVGTKLSDVMGKYVTSSKNADVNGLVPSLQTNVSNMAKDYYEQTGKKLNINSGNRSNEEQSRLYKTLPKGMAAPPGSSLHNFGLALDVPTAQANELAKLGLLDKYGLSRPLMNAKVPEPWHLQPKGISLAAAKAGIYSGDAPINQTPVSRPQPVMSNEEAITVETNTIRQAQAMNSGSDNDSYVTTSPKETVSQNTKTSVMDIPLVDPSDGFLNALNLGVL